jgi:hypothetical protein
MNFKQLKLSVAFLLGLGLTGLQAQTMYVKESNGAQTAYALGNIQKMSFSSGNLTVTKTGNNSEVYDLSDLRYLKFSDISSGLDKPLLVEKQVLHAYPNPVHDRLNIDLSGIAEKKGVISLFNFEGNVIMSRQVTRAGIVSLDISHLPEGIYLCRFSNQTDATTIKIIKK